MPEPIDIDAEDRPEFWTIDECAALLRVGRNAIVDLIARGELHAVHVGRAVRIDADDLAEFVAKGGSGPSQYRPRQATTAGDIESPDETQSPKAEKDEDANRHPHQADPAAIAGSHQDPA